MPEDEPDTSGKEKASKGKSKEEAPKEDVTGPEEPEETGPVKGIAEGDILPIQFETLFRERTTKQQAEKALYESKGRFRTVFDHAAIGIGRINLKDDLWIEANNTLCEMLGYTCEEMMEIPWTKMTYPEDLELDCAQYKKMAEGLLENYTIEKRYIHKTGRSVWTRCTRSLVRDDKGDPYYAIAIIENIGDRKMAEKELQESRTKLKAAIDSMTDAVFITDVQGNVIESNDAFAAYYRFKNKEESVKTLEEYTRILEVYLPDGSLAPVEKWAVPRALRGEVGKSADYKLRRKDTGEIWYGSYSFAPIRYDGTIVGSVVVARDMTESKRNEKALSESERKYRELIETANSIIIRWNNQGKILFINDYGLRFMGYTADELVGRDVSKLMPQVEESSGRTFQSLIMDIVSHPEQYKNMPSEIMTKDARVCWVIWANKAALDENGKVVEILTIGNDITDLKKAQTQLVSISEQRQLTLDAAKMGWWQYDPGTGMMNWDDGFKKIFGVEGYALRTDLLHSTMVLPDDLPALQEKIKKALDPLDPKLFSVEYRIKRPDGGIRWIEAHGAASFERLGAERRATNFVGTVADITERKDAIESIRISAERFDSITNSPIWGIAIGDFQGNLRFVNDCFLEIVGYPRDEFEQRKIKWTDLTPREFSPLDDAAIGQMKERGNAPPYEKQYIRKDGSRAWIEIAHSILPGPEKLVYAVVMDITERKEAEEQIRRSKEFTDRVLSSSLNGLYIMELEKHAINFINTRYTQLTGFTLKEISEMGKSSKLFDQFHPEDLPRILDYEKKMKDLGKNEIREIEYRFRRKDGEWRYFLSRETEFSRHPDGAVREYMGTFIDITDRKKAEEELRRSEEKFEKLFKQNPNFALISDFETGESLEVNDAYCELTGYSRKELVGHTSAELGILSLATRQKLQSILLTTGELFDQEIHIHTKSGEIRTVVISVEPIIFSSRKAIITSGADITEKNKAEEAIRESKELFETLFRSSPAVIAYSRVEDGVFIDVNRVFEELTGYSRKEALSHSAKELSIWVRPEQRDLMVKMVLESGQWHDEVSIRRKSGEIRNLLMSAEPIEIKGVSYILTMAQDITDRKRIEKVIRESEERFRDLANAMPQIVWTSDPNGKVDYFNDRYTELKGIDRLEDGSFRWGPPLHHDDLERTDKAWNDSLRTGRPYQIEHRVQRSDGSYHWYLSRGMPVRDREGKIVKWFGTTTDIDDIKRAEETMHHQAEMFKKLIDTVPAMIAIYDPQLSIFKFNKPLTDILGWTEEDASEGDFLAKVYPDPEYRAKVEKFMHENQSGWCDYKLRAKDGSIVDSSWTNISLSDNTWIGIGIDVRDRLEHEEELRTALEEAEEGRRLLDTMMANVPEGITIVDAPDGRIRMVSQYGKDVLGSPKGMKTPGEVAQKWKIYKPDGVTPLTDEELPIIKAMRQGEIVKNMEVVQENVSGERLTLLCNAAPIRNVEGLITGGIVAWRDITDMKNAEAALHESEERYRGIFEESQAVMLLIDPETSEIVDANPSATRYYGYGRDEFKQMKISDLDVMSAPEFFKEIQKEPAGEKRIFTFTHRLSKGEMRKVDVYNGSVRIMGRQLMHMIIFDVTEKRKAEDEMKDRHQQWA